MKLLKPYILFCTFGILVMLMAGCRKEVGVIAPETTQLMNPGEYGSGMDFYLLNEGNMGSNHCSLDFFNHSAGTYALNIYESVNPSVTLGLGDVGNDIEIYGGKLYVVVNGSGKVEVLEKGSAVKLCQIEVPNCRSLAFWNSKVFVTSYNGFVGVVDTSVLQNGAGSVQLDKQIAVGREPEGLAVAANQLYVANSGGYSPPLYDHTVSVIDLNTLSVSKTIDLGINLNDVQADNYGHVVVSARGNYAEVAPSFYVLDASTGEVLKHEQIPVGNFAISDSILYYFTSSYQANNQKVSYKRYNLKTLSAIAGSFLTSNLSEKIQFPYALKVDPKGNRILISDAGDYTSPGTLYWVDMEGNVLWQVQTGEIPGHIAFL
ncbi:YncE family protein [Arachidicoccus rhizosphaerae]|nr:DUF5074 domain-containing protein [Arachidicoccus rhizosphaerae]